MSKLSITLLVVGLSLLVVCNGSSLSREPSEASDLDTSGLSGFAKRLFKECKKNTGAYDAFAAVMEAYHNSTICLTKFDAQSFMVDLNQLSTETRTGFFSKYCSEARSLISCFDGVQASWRPCLQERDFNIMKGVVNSIPKALDFVCQNDGEIVFKLKDEQRQACFMPKIEQIRECVNTFESNWNYDWNAYELTQDQCSIITSYRQCIKDHLDACNMSDAIRIFDIVKDAFFLQTPCVNSAEKSKVNLIDKNTADEV
ncbi:27 kDa hemolymph protein-like [Anopheles darlingi]|uniref:27 kDa hemolymph protein-like n=1 Tax=Anopheles darlingi TaxID=43151 RepID=UPI0021004A95|nr:27 kDa hemolymph protein-like [Anopheles darlingi]